MAVSRIEDRPLAAAIYARISDDREGDALGVTRQVEDCRALAERRGWRVAGEYIDNDVSAYSGKHRPEYRRLLEDMGQGRVDAVIVWHLDRLHRSPKELEEFFDVAGNAGIADMGTVTGDVNLATSDGQFHARIMGAVARKESDDKSRRIRRKHLELAEAGKVAGGGTRPFGFEADRVTVRAEEAMLIREAADRILSGDSLRGIAADWLRRGLLAPSGKPWTSTPLRRMLTSSRIAGWRQHKGEPIAQAVWPAIIERAMSDRLVSVLTNPARRKVTDSARTYLLSGLLTCDLCGKPLRARPRLDHVRRYICASGPTFRGCGKIAILAGPLEELISDAILLRLDSPAFENAVRARADASPVDGDTTELRAAEARLAELGHDYAAGDVPRVAFLAASRDLDARIEQLRRHLAADTGRRAAFAVSGVARERWPALSIDQRRAVIAELVERITVGAGRRGLNRFDPTRIDVEWTA